MANQYTKMMEVLKRWPLDKSKGARDYGSHLRNLAKSAFPAGQIFAGSDVVVEEKYNSLFRLADNKYKKFYASSRTIGATGLTIDQLHHAMSEKFVNEYLR